MTYAAATQILSMPVHSQAVTFVRSRLLKKALPMKADDVETVSLAANGRKSRRIAIIAMGDGREMDAFDIGVDDDDEDGDMTGDATAEVSGLFDITTDSPDGAADTSAFSMEVE